MDEQPANKDNPPPGLELPTTAFTCLQDPSSFPVQAHRYKKNTRTNQPHTEEASNSGPEQEEETTQPPEEEPQESSSRSLEKQVFLQQNHDHLNKLQHTKKWRGMGNRRMVGVGVRHGGL